VPLLGLTEHPHNTADRYSYLASLIFSLGFAIFLLRFGLTSRARAVCLALSAAILVALGADSYRQTLVWNDSVTLFQHVLTTVGDHPYRSDIEMRLGAALLETGDFVDAEKHLRQSVKLDPSRFQTHAHLANLLSIRGEFAGAINEYDTAVSLNPTYVGGLVKKAKLFHLVGNTPEAINFYRQALARDPNRADALQGLAWIRATDRHSEYRSGAEAVQLALRAREISRGDSLENLLTLSVAYGEAGQLQNATNTVAAALNFAIESRDEAALRRASGIVHALQAHGYYRDQESLAQQGSAPHEPAGAPASSQ
jgi:tetratricopeptide (TPR) repeat protein